MDFPPVMRTPRLATARENTVDAHAHRKTVFTWEIMCDFQNFIKVLYMPLFRNRDIPFRCANEAAQRNLHDAWPCTTPVQFLQRQLLLLVLLFNCLCMQSTRSVIFLHLFLFVDFFSFFIKFPPCCYPPRGLGSWFMPPPPPKKKS